MNKMILAPLVALLAVSALILANIPVSKLYALKTQYVALEVLSDGGVSYRYTPRKPSAWIEIEDVARSTYMALVISEDWSFFEHPGFDIEQVKIALFDYLKGKKLRGASTISQQVVKNLFTSGERTLGRKIKEFFSTLALEKILTKKQILEIYLNIIQYGDKVYGIDNGARFYFQKRASSLTVKEAAFMAMLLPSPIRYAQSFREQKLSPYARETVNNILFKLSLVKVVKKKNLEALQNEPLSFESVMGIDYLLEQIKKVSTGLQ